MLTTSPSQPRTRSSLLREPLSVLTALLLSARLVCPADAEQGGIRPTLDRRVLSEIARDVVKRGATGPTQSEPTQTLPAAEAEPETTAAEAPDGPIPATSIAPPSQTVAVPIPPGAAAARQAKPDTTAAGYQSNSGRQRPQELRTLGFASGILPPASGLDPALKDHAHGLRAQ